MKKLSLLLLLLPGALSLQATDFQTDGLRANSGVGPVYALASAITGTTSSPVSMTAYSGMFVSVSGTNGVSVEVQWLIDASAAQMSWSTADVIPVNSTPRWESKQGSTARFRVYPVVSTNYASAIKCVASVSYIPVVAGTTVGVGSPANKSESALASTSSFTYIYCTCTAQPCDVTFQNTAANLTMLWALEPSISAPGFNGFQMLSGSPPLNIPVVPGQNWFQWSFTTTGGSGVEQNHW